jgi:cytochrome oxidase Cu insertion factor (SCO1/SenC/PrrC family)
MAAGSRMVPLLLLLAAGCMQTENAGPEGGPGIGKTALPIDGRDADGRPMQLSEYRGKVVLLDFWQTL